MASSYYSLLDNEKALANVQKFSFWEEEEKTEAEDMWETVNKAVANKGNTQKAKDDEVLRQAIAEQMEMTRVAVRAALNRMLLRD